jgi:hypothetical protein
MEAEIASHILKVNISQTSTGMILKFNGLS